MIKFEYACSFLVLSLAIATNAATATITTTTINTTTTAPSTFSCGSLSVFDCKTKFGERFQQEIFQINFSLNLNAIIKRIQFYNKILESLPEPQATGPPTSTAAVAAALMAIKFKFIEKLHKLNMEIFDTPDGWANLQQLHVIEDEEPNLSEISADRELEILFQKILRDHEQYEEQLYQSENRNQRLLFHYDLIVATIDIWKTLYAALRTIDFFAYPEYKYLNRNFDILLMDKSLRVKYVDFLSTMDKVAKFFEMNIFKMLP